MESTLISQFIDDELSLPEKIAFLRSIRNDPASCDEAIGFLEQESVLVRQVKLNRPMLTLKPIRLRKPAFSFMRWVAAIPVAAAFLFLLIWYKPGPAPLTVTSPAPISHRFVIYAPEIRQAEIAGSFSNWEPIPMKPIGAHGYWELTLSMKPGEYRYSILLDRKSRMADPTVPLKEADDFGSANSILRIG